MLDGSLAVAYNAAVLPRSAAMLLGYVSDERYVALADVLMEFTDERGGSWEVRSRASGSVHADLAPGNYTVTLHKPGFGGKRVQLTVPCVRCP